ncbi:hypothetical protein LCGC14_1898390 [marine sediment metagenome]|uniref:Uncharacterized protein n=1 Tax=marine sediment metagenome TaxID=412755 RepID=A0A0F9IB70_9ZZZZ
MGAVNRDLEETTSNKAEDLAEQRYGREFHDLPASLQMATWMDAELEIAINLACEADMFRIKEKEEGK